MRKITIQDSNLIVLVKSVKCDTHGGALFVARICDVPGSVDTRLVGTGRHRLGLSFSTDCTWRKRKSCSPATAANRKLTGAMHQSVH